jgi:hypothetical protein
LSERDRDILNVSTEPRQQDRFIHGCALGVSIALLLWAMIIMAVLTLAQQLR